MTEFTKEKPFEFEGVKIWRDGAVFCVDANATGRSRDKHTFFTAGVARFLHAFIEAERNTDWQWAPEPANEARKGPWRVKRPEHEGAYYLFHDDLTDGDHITAIFHDSLEPDENAARMGISPGCVEAFKSFLAWRDTVNDVAARNAKLDERVASINDAMAKFNAAMQRTPAPKTAHAVATVEVRLDLNGLADDLQAACDAVRARLESGLN